MNRSQKKNGACLFLVGFLLLSVGISTANAAENILGDWEFTMDMGDMGGMGGGMNITINSTFTEGDGGIITGTWEMVFDMPEGGFRGGPGGGGFQMPTFKIVDVNIDGQNLSFTRKAEGDAGGMGGMMMEDRQFTGTIKGDTIELTSSSNFGEMTYKGTRKAAQQILEGDWEFITIVEDMGMEFRNNATFTKDANATYAGTWEMIMDDMGEMGPPPGEGPTFEIKIEDIKLEDDKVTFVQKFSMGGDMGMGEMVFNYTGTLKGDKIEGGFSGEMGDSVSNGTRKKATAVADDILTGDWELKMSMADSGMGMGSMEFTINSTITKDAEGKYSMTWEQVMNQPEGGFGDAPTFNVTVEDIKLDGNKLTFARKVDMGGMRGMGMGGEMVSNFTGTIEDGKINGTVVSDFGDMTLTGSKKQ